jgi:hypothetical protein
LDFNIIRYGINEIVCGFLSQRNSLAAEALLVTSIQTDWLRKRCFWYQSKPIGSRSAAFDINPNRLAPEALLLTSIQTDWLQKRCF